MSAGAFLPPCGSTVFSLPASVHVGAHLLAPPSRVWAALWAGGKHHGAHDASSYCRKSGFDQSGGLHHDGDGLYLRVTAISGSKSWMLGYTLSGTTRDMGLGAYPKTSLASARKQADASRELVGRRVDPIATRKAAEAAQKAALGGTTFKACAEALIASNEGAWRNPKHRQQWRNTLNTYAYPVIGSLPVATVDTTLVLKILEPIWQTVPETASRLRGRMERVLDAAKARGLRSGENPCRWRGHINMLLPAKSKLRRVVHHAALPYAELPTFMHDLRRRQGITPRSLEFLVLTAARTARPSKRAGTKGFLLFLTLPGRCPSTP